MLDAASKLAFTLSVVMLGVAVSALVTRFAHPSVSVLALAIFRRITDVLFFAYLLIHGQFFFAFILALVSSGVEFRQAHRFTRDSLIAVALWTGLLGALGVLDKLGIVYMRPAVLLTVAFLMLIGMVWGALAVSKDQPKQSA